MNKALEALHRMYTHLLKCHIVDYQIVEDALKRLEEWEKILLENKIDVNSLYAFLDDVEENLKKLKAFEIIKEKDVSMLPIYKNLAYVSPAGESVYLDENTLVTMVRDIVSKLNMEEQSEIGCSFFTLPAKSCQRGIFPINGLCYNGIPQKFFE